MTSGILPDGQKWACPLVGTCYEFPNWKEMQSLMHSVDAFIKVCLQTHGKHRPGSTSLNQPYTSQSRAHMRAQQLTNNHPCRTEHKNNSTSAAHNAHRPPSCRQCPNSASLETTSIGLDIHSSKAYFTSCQAGTQQANQSASRPVNCLPGRVAAA